MHLSKHFGGLACVVLLACLAHASSAGAVVPGQIDTFEDGTTQNWVINLLGLGSPPPEAMPANIPTGGPAGVDDNYLRLTSIGTEQAGGRLVVINATQWTGNYLAAGISALTMQVNNLGSTELHLRLLFADPVTGPPTNEAISSRAVVVPAGSGWLPVTFPIAQSDLTAVAGSTAAALTNTTEVRIFHSVTTVFPPNPLAASLGVDNIQAVPEPSTVLMLGAALTASRIFRKRAPDNPAMNIRLFG